MDVEIGKINKLVVDRKTDIGYVLMNSDDYEVFIHNNQVTRELVVGEDLDIYVFLDKEKRITGTMEVPNILVDEPGFVKVKSVIENLGVFIDNNIVKDTLISIDDLPLDKKKWPEEGDTLYCKLKNTKTQLKGRIVTPREIVNYIVPETPLEKHQKVEAYVIKTGNEGVNLLTIDGHDIFVYYKHKRRDYRIGETVEVTIVNIKEDNTYNATFLETKVPLMENDAEIILEYIKKKHGFIPFNTKSEIRAIEKEFKMSKAAFKRGLSNLYKKRLIEIKEDGTYLVK